MVRSIIVEVLREPDSDSRPSSKRQWCTEGGWRTPQAVRRKAEAVSRSPSEPPRLAFDPQRRRRRRADGLHRAVRGHLAEDEAVGRDVDDGQVRDDAAD